MGSEEEPSVSFLAVAETTTQSAAHRCLMVSRELSGRGYRSKCYLSGSFLKKVPNFSNHASNWKKILNEHPNFVVVNRSCNIVDYEMVKKIKKQRSRTKVIFDFDDAIFHTRLPGRIASYSYLNKMLKLSDAVTAGSHYLQEFASKFNENVILLPSAVDTALFNPNMRRPVQGDFVIGWLGAGNRHQLRYLRILKEPLNVLAQKYDFRFKIVSALSSAVKKAFSNQRFPVDFGLDHWVPMSETPVLIADFDAGVMPLTDGKWERGKCAMKLLEYMSMKLPTVSSAVGENRYVIDQGRNGFIASDSEEWADRIERLIVDRDLRENLGQNGYKTVEERYSLQVVVDTLEQVFKELHDTEST